MNKVESLLRQALHELENPQIVTQHQPRYAWGGKLEPRTVIWIKPENEEQMAHLKLFAERVPKSAGLTVGFTGLDDDTLLIAMPDNP